MAKQRAVVVDFDGVVENIIVIDDGQAFSLQDKEIVPHAGHIDIGWRRNEEAKTFVGRRRIKNDLGEDVDADITVPVGGRSVSVKVITRGDQ